MVSLHGIGGAPEPTLSDNWLLCQRVKLKKRLAKMAQFYSQKGLSAVFNMQLNDALIES